LAIVVSFASAIVGGIAGWFGHGAWSQRTRGDHSPTIRAEGHSNVLNAGRDVVHVGELGGEKARVVFEFENSGQGCNVAIRNVGQGHATNVSFRWEAVDEQAQPVHRLDVTPPATLSAGAGAPLGRVYAAWGQGMVDFFVGWTNPDGSSDETHERH
jgi:hypothetical protein